MKFKGTYLGLALAIGLGAYIYFVELKKDKENESKTKIVDMDTDKVKKLKFKNSHGEISVEKVEKDWKLTSPVADLADGAAINSVLSTIATESSDTTVTGKTDLKPFGLAEDKVVLEWEQEGKPPQKLSVGDEAPLAGKLYVRINGASEIRVVSSLIKTQVEKTLKDLRDKKLFRDAKEAISQVKIKVNRKDLRGDTTLSKKDGNWLIEKGSESLKADKDTVQSVLNQIEGLRASEFSSETGNDPKTLKEFGLTQPEVILEAFNDAKKSLFKMQVSSKKEGNAYAVVEGRPTVFQIFGSTADSFAKKGDDFRDKKGPFEFDRTMVKEIELKTGMFETQILNKENAWKLKADDPKKEVSQVQVGNLLQKLSDLKVAEFVTDKVLEKKLDKKVSLKDSEGKEVLTLLWGEKSKTQKYFVKSSKDNGVYGVETASLDTLPAQTLLKEKGAPDSVMPKESTDPELPEEEHHH